MARNHARPSRDWDEEDDTDADLIDHTQEELRRAIAGVAPESVPHLACDLFYEVYKAVIRRYAIRSGVRTQDLDDCVQAVFVKVIKKLPAFQRQGRGSFRRWLFLLVHSEAIDGIRQHTRHPIQALSEIQGTDREPVDPRLDVGAASERLFEVELVQACLAEVRKEESKENYEVVRLRWIVGKSPPEIAAMLGLSEQAVRSRLHRMLEVLRAKINALSGHGFDRSVDSLEDGT